MMGKLQQLARILGDVVFRRLCRAKIISRVVLLLMIIAAPSQASDQLKSGTAISKKFSLVFSVPGLDRECKHVLSSLNQPTIFSGNLSAALLSTRDTLIWQKRRPDGGWRGPRTVGEIDSHDIPESLSVDLDGDGETEFILRDWVEYKAQPYNELLLPPSSAEGAVSATKLITPETLQKTLDDAGTGINIDSSFYLFEFIAAEPRPYLVALSTIWVFERSDRPAYVLQFRHDLTPALVCVMQTTVFGPPDTETDGN